MEQKKLKIYSAKDVDLIPQLSIISEEEKSDILMQNLDDLK